MVCGRLEAYLTIRGEEFLKQLQADGAVGSHGLPVDVSEQFAPGAGMGQDGVIADGNGTAVKKRR